MKIPTPPRKFKGLAARAFYLGAGLAGFLVSCAPVIAEAPFPARPDTAEAGDLLGPFDGRVVDADSGKPIAGATVFASWGFEIGRGLTAPAGGWTETTETNSDGRYLIRHLRAVPGSRVRVMRFSLIIYKSGYIGYRSDRRFDDFSERHDFAQHLNAAKLERMSAQVSHVRHIRFLGGGASIKKALDRELVEAGLELSEPPRTAEKPGPPLDASVLLAEAELRAATGYTGKFTVEKLADLPTSSSYDSRHFKAVDKPESYDAAIRVWKLPAAAAAEARYDAIRRGMPNGEDKDEMGDRSLRGQDGKIMAAAVLDRERGLVIELTCGTDLCRDADQTAQLLKRLLGRADRLGRPKSETGTESETEPDSEKAPDKDKEKEENPFKLREPELKR